MQHNQKGITICKLFSLIVLLCSCSFVNDSKSTSSIEWKYLDDTTGYWQVNLDFDSVKSHYDLGVVYGNAILKGKKNYAKIVDSYLSRLPMDRMLAYMAVIRPQVPKEYQEEIEGLASVICKTTASSKGDGKLSIEEVYAFELITDTWRATGCSGLGVWGEISIDGKVRVIRLLDYYSGGKDSISSLNAITTIKNKAKSISIIGYLGMLGVLTGINESGVFVGVLDSKTGGTYYANDANSYCMDLRYAIENYDNIDSVAEYMIDLSRKYAFNHNILVADKNECKVVENNVSGDNKPRRMTRTTTTELNPGIIWPFIDSICVVNSFVSKNQSFNHNIAKNEKRWESYINQMKKYKKFGEKELKEIAGYYTGSSPGEADVGDIYIDYGNLYKTMQVIYFEPETFKLEIAFLPNSGNLPLFPKFMNIPIKE